MAQKQPADQSRRWLGLTGSAVLLANLVLTGTSIAFQQEGEVNHALGIEGSNASYGGTEFSADGSLTDTFRPPMNSVSRKRRKAAFCCITAITHCPSPNLSAT